MISWVNPKIIVKSVNEKGIGSFAKASIAKNEIVIIQGGQIIENSRLKEPAFEPFVDHCFQIEKGFHICPIELKKEKLDGVFQVNHSCNPNCGFRGQVTLVAIRDIESGEEITYDYAMTDANWHDVVCTKMKCLCGAGCCRGIITGDDWKRRDLQEKYRGYFSTYIQEMIDGF